MDKGLRFIADLIEPLRVAPGSTVKLSRDHDPGYTGQVTRPQATALLADGVRLLAKYQDRLAAQDTFGVLLVLQGLDASGKDSTIKHTMSCVNPQAVAVRAFKQPSAEELNHDFLWRYQCALPGRGRIGIFNRSTTRRCSSSGCIRTCSPRSGCPRRQRKATSGTAGIGRSTTGSATWSTTPSMSSRSCSTCQRESRAKRFIKRIDHPAKNWKFSPSDVRERRHWDDYQRACWCALVPGAR